MQIQYIVGTFSKNPSSTYLNRVMVRIRLSEPYCPKIAPNWAQYAWLPGRWTIHINFGSQSARQGQVNCSWKWPNDTYLSFFIYFGAELMIIDSSVDSRTRLFQTVSTQQPGTGFVRLMCIWMRRISGYVLNTFCPVCSHFSEIFRT